MLLLFTTACEQGPQYDYRPEAASGFSPESVASYLHTDSIKAAWQEWSARKQYDSLMYLTELLKNYKEEVALEYAAAARSLAMRKNWRYARAVSSYYVAMLKGRREYYGEGIYGAMVDAQLSDMLLKEDEVFWKVSIQTLMGSFFREQFEMDSARHYLQLALNRVERGKLSQRDSLRLRGEILHELMGVYAFIDKDKVTDVFTESMTLYQLTGNQAELARLRLGLARIIGEDDQFEAAGKLVDKSLAYAEQTNDNNLRVDALLKRGWLELESYLKDEEEAHITRGMEALKTALSLQTENKYYTYELIGALYQAKISRQKAYDLTKYAVSYYKSAIISAREEGALSLVRSMGDKISLLCSYLDEYVDCEEILEMSTAQFLNENYKGIVDTITTQLVVANTQAQNNQITELQANAYRVRRNQLLVSAVILVLAILIFLLLLQQQQKRRLRARMEALRAQINPHFISNSLNAIESLVNLDQKEAASKYLVHFSRLSRRILNSSREANTSLAGELETLKHFLALEQLRFRDKLSYSIEVEDGINPHLLEVPSMIMQPYVENAIWHGLKPKPTPGSLKVYVRQENKRLVCSIEDDGIGRDKSRELKEKSVLKRKSLGMQITEERLRANQKVRSGNVEIIDLKDAEGNALGTRVVLYLPLKTRKKKTDSTPIK